MGWAIGFGMNKELNSLDGCVQAQRSGDNRRKIKTRREPSKISAVLFMFNPSVCSLGSF